MNIKKPETPKPPTHHSHKPDDEDWDLPKEVEHRHLGLWMVVLAWLMIILLLAFSFDSWLTKQAGSNRVEQKVMVQAGIPHTHIKRTIQNQYLGKGTINHHPVIFLLDTGATDVVIPGKLAEKLNLKMGFAGYANTAGGRIKIYLTKIDELTIGHITITNLRATINPSMHGEEVLLGMSALKHVSFTQRGDTLILHVDP